MKLPILPCVWIASLALAAGMLPAQAQFWTKTLSLNGRFHPRMAFNSWDGSLLLFGGWNGTTYMRDTWVWNGNQWTQRSEFGQNAPPPRSGHALAHHTASAYTILFGGRCGGICRLNDTWRWDGHGWEQVIPRDTPGNPVPRFDHDVIDETSRGRLLLFGGSTGEKLLNDTWIFSNDRWELLVPANSPSPRNGMRLAYDPKRDRVVLFGGWDGSRFLADTWEWNGSNWVKRFPRTRPPARALFSMSVTQRGRVALFGGRGPSGIKDDFWEWDGDNWAELHADFMPPMRSEHDMAFDARRHRLVLYGGWKGTSTNFPDDTWELVLENPAISTQVGLGCPGTEGRPTLVPAPGNLPWVGDSFTVEAHDLPRAASQPAFGILGFSNRIWKSQALPLDLASLGMPGCVLLTSIDRIIPLNKRGNEAEWTIEIPGESIFEGFRFHMQVMVADFGVNFLGVTTSNAISQTVGSR